MSDGSQMAGTRDTVIGGLGGLWLGRALLGIIKRYHGPPKHKGLIHQVLDSQVLAVGGGGYCHCPLVSNVCLSFNVSCSVSPEETAT